MPNQMDIIAQDLIDAQVELDNLIERKTELEKYIESKTREMESLYDKYNTGNYLQCSPDEHLMAQYDDKFGDDFSFNGEE